MVEVDVGFAAVEVTVDFVDVDIVAVVDVVVQVDMVVDVDVVAELDEVVCDVSVEPAVTELVLVVVSSRAEVVVSIEASVVIDPAGVVAEGVAEVTVGGLLVLGLNPMHQLPQPRSGASRHWLSASQQGFHCTNGLPGAPAHLAPRAWHVGSVPEAGAGTHH